MPKQQPKDQPQNDPKQDRQSPPKPHRRPPGSRPPGHHQHRTGIQPIVPRSKRPVRLIVPLYLAMVWLFASAALAQDPSGELDQLLRQFQEEGQWIREEMRAAEAEQKALLKAQQLPLRPDEPAVPRAPVAPQPMSRAETVGQAPPQPPRFAGRAAIREVAYALEEAVVECVAFRVCAVFLEPGERIGDRNLGDVDRWNYREGYAGPAGVETPVVSVQPLGWNLETNLLLFTDRRVYRLTLRGLPKPKAGSTVEYTEALSFRYPQQPKTLAPPPARRADQRTMAAAGLGALDFGYRVEAPRKRRERFRWQPTAIFDDGERVFVYLPERAFLDDAPLLVGLDAENEPVQVNAALRRDPRTGRRYFEVPRLIGSLELFVGQGRGRRWWRIHRTGAR